jgi:type IV secretion system protein VirD4
MTASRTSRSSWRLFRPLMMIVTMVVFMPGIEHWLAAFGKTRSSAKLMLGRIRPRAALCRSRHCDRHDLSVRGKCRAAANIKACRRGASSAEMESRQSLIAVLRETARLARASRATLPKGRVRCWDMPIPRRCSAQGHQRWLAGVFALRVAIKGNAAFAPKFRTPADSRKASGAWRGRLDDAGRRP